MNTLCLNGRLLPLNYIRSMRVETEVIKAGDPLAAGKAARAVCGGAVIVYPTETLYGIGGLALNRGAARRTSDIKRRPPGKPFPVLVRDVEMLSRYFTVTDRQAAAYERMLPLPLTLVLRPKRPGAFPPETSKNGATAARVSRGEFVRRLFELIDEPLISSSANISGGPGVKDGQDAERVFGGGVELIVDSGNLPPSEGSAIVSLAGEKPEILRSGDLGPEQLGEFLQWLS